MGYDPKEHLFNPADMVHCPSTLTPEVQEKEKAASPSPPPKTVETPHVPLPRLTMLDEAHYGAKVATKVRFKVRPIRTANP
jgi:hypothetical protein